MGDVGAGSRPRRQDLGLSTDVGGMIECRPGARLWGPGDEDSVWEPAIDLFLLNRGNAYDGLACLFGIRNSFGFRPWRKAVASRMTPRTGFEVSSPPMAVNSRRIRDHLADVGWIERRGLAGDRRLWHTQPGQDVHARTAAAGRGPAEGGRTGRPLRGPPRSLRCRVPRPSARPARGRPAHGETRLAGDPSARRRKAVGKRRTKSCTNSVLAPRPGCQSLHPEDPVRAPTGSGARSAPVARTW